MSSSSLVPRDGAAGGEGRPTVVVKPIAARPILYDGVVPTATTTLRRLTSDKQADA